MNIYQRLAYGRSGNGPQLCICCFDLLTDDDTDHSVCEACWEVLDVMGVEPNPKTVIVILTKAQAETLAQGDVDLSIMRAAANAVRGHSTTFGL